MTTLADEINAAWAEVARQEREHIAEWQADIEAGRVPRRPFLGLHERKELESDRADMLIMLAVNRREPVSYTDAMRISALAGRIYGPRVLYTLDQVGLLQDEAYPRMVPAVWGQAEFPGMALDHADWLRLWNRAGFVIDSVRSERPTEPVRLYRGSPNRYKRLFSWTADLDRAKWFAKARSNAGVGQAFVWTTLAPPSSLLGYIHEVGRGEDEWVVNARRLDIALVE